MLPVALLEKYRSDLLDHFDPTTTPRRDAQMEAMVEIITWMPPNYS